MTENSDPRPLHRRAIAQTETAVAAVTPDQFALPTPCTEYDVRALLSELALWALISAKRILPPDIRGDAGVPFGPVVEVSPDATPYTQLAAWLGRRP